MSTPAIDQRKAVTRLKRKADQQATAHSWLRDRYRAFNSAFTIVSLVSSVLLLAVVMATPEYVEATIGIPMLYYQWVMAFFAAGAFSMTVVQLALRYDARAALHEQAVRHYARASYEASRLAARPDHPTEDEVSTLRNVYLDDQDLPRIPEKKFLPLKQWHLQKLAASKRLDKEFHRPLEDILRDGPIVDDEESEA